MSDPAKWIPEAYEFDERCRLLVKRHEHLRNGDEMLVVEVQPHIVIQHSTWWSNPREGESRRVEELCVFYSPTHEKHTTCYMSQDKAMHLLTANDHWWPAIRAAVPFLREHMVLDDLAECADAPEG
jgi:hypothetical protein